MIEVRNTAREVHRLRVRLVVALLAVTACFGILAARLWTLQVARYDAYHAQARCLDCKFQKPAYLGLQAQCPSVETPAERGSR